MNDTRAPRSAVFGIVVLASAFVAGCGADAPPAGGGSGEAKASESGAADERKLVVGDETTLSGLGDGQVKVVVLEIEDPMKSPPPKGLVQERPKPGRRFVGVHVRLTNLGKKSYEDSPLNGSRLVTSVKGAANPTILLSGPCRSKFGTGLKLAPGATKTGCLPFQVKRGVKVTGFQFTLDSGYGGETGEWSLR